MNWTNYAPSLTILSLLIATSPVAAGETRWFETDGGNVRIVTEPYAPGADFVRGIIDIDLQPGWKTYWRDPGSGGIPPSIQVNDLDVVRSTHIDFPVPNWISSKYGSYAGYEAPVQIPFTFVTNGPATDQIIQARVFIGICKEICIPAFTDFNVPLIEANGSSRSAWVVANAFDANSLLYITKAADYYDFSHKSSKGTVIRDFSESRARYLVISYSSDWLYPTYQSKELVQALKRAGRDVSFCEIEADAGHDAFLIPDKRLQNLLRGFLDGITRNH